MEEKALSTGGRLGQGAARFKKCQDEQNSSIYTFPQVIALVDFQDVKDPPDAFF